MPAHRSYEKTKKRLKVVGGAVAVLSLVGFGAPVVADKLVTSPNIKDGAVHSPDIADQGVRSPDIRDGGVHWRDLSPDLKERVDGVVTRKSVSEVKPVEKVGGSWGTLAATNATLLDELTLPAGRWVVDADGFFVTTEADPNRDVRMQLAVRYDDGTDWGADAGTSFTDTLSPAKDREATTHSTRVVKLDEKTTIQVFAFGYEDDQGAGASGQVDAQSFVTAQRVG